jgi:hypothetical protein
MQSKGKDASVYDYKEEQEQPIPNSGMTTDGKLYEYRTSL